MTLIESAPLAATTTRARGESVSVVIPMSAHAVAGVLTRLAERVNEVVLVDGRSTGKGAALRAGFAAARGSCIVMIDAGESVDPAEIERFVDALQAGCLAG